MVNETVSFGMSALLTVLGLAVLLYGVSLNNGQALNAPIVVGGLFVLLATGVLSAAVQNLEGGHGAE
jgi:hypothetical protein